MLTLFQIKSTGRFRLRKGNLRVALFLYLKIDQCLFIRVGGLPTNGMNIKQIKTNQ